MHFFIKTLVSAVLISVISELSKKSSLLGGLLASLPLTTFLALVWLYADTRSVDKAAALSMSVFWLVLPSLVFFPCLSFLLKNARWPFAGAMTGSTAIMFCAYGLMLVLLRRTGAFH